MPHALGRARVGTGVGDEPPARPGRAGASRFKHVIKREGGRCRRLVPDELDLPQAFPGGWAGTGMTDGRRASCMGNALVVGVVRRIAKELYGSIAACGQQSRPDSQWRESLRVGRTARAWFAQRAAHAQQARRVSIWSMLVTHKSHVVHVRVSFGGPPCILFRRRSCPWSCPSRSRRCWCRPRRWRRSRGLIPRRRRRRMGEPSPRRVMLPRQLRMPRTP